MTAPNSGVKVVMADKEVVKVEYINLAGMHSAKPWSGVNIEVTTYDDGTTSTAKVVIK